MPRSTPSPSQVSQYRGRKNSSRTIAARELSTLPPLAHSISLVYSLLQRLRSLRYRLWYGISERVRWSRGVFFELPARELPAVAFEQPQRVAALQRRYQVHFEEGMNAATSLNNYEYLDILDRTWTDSGLPRPQGGVVCDVGSASFWYAAALDAFFRPTELVGVEIEGYRLFKDGHSRIDYAAGYVRQIPGARFLVADYIDCNLPADVITAWFPFVRSAALLAWRLPLSMLKPERLFACIYHNLRPKGLLVLVSHGVAEAAIGRLLCKAAGLTLLSTFADVGAFSGHRVSPAVVSCWTRA
jgi:SAM-dependent methyltransferase